MHLGVEFSLPFLSSTDSAPQPVGGDVRVLVEGCYLGEG